MTLYRSLSVDLPVEMCSRTAATAVSRSNNNNNNQEGGMAWHGMAQESSRTAKLNVRSFGNLQLKRCEAQQDDGNHFDEARRI